MKNSSTSLLEEAPAQQRNAEPKLLIGLDHIYVIHHSHLDLGFTHSQVVLEQLQTDFLDQVLKLLDETEEWEPISQPRWTIEVHQQLKLWLESASAEKIAKLKHHVARQRIGLGAIQYNTTPLASLESLCRQLVDVREYPEKYGFAIKAAFQHDVNGIPWAMSDLLLDSAVELFVMGINLHSGGNGPIRPGMFNWKTPQGRKLRVFSGHHYSTFDVIARPWEASIDQMKVSLNEHWQFLRQRGYKHSFVYLSSTNLPVAYDNGGPSRLTMEKIRLWNAEVATPKIQYVTPEQLLQRLKEIPDNELQEYHGDWSGFWNYGAGSTAQEVAINAGAKQNLFNAAMLSTQLPQNDRLDRLQQSAWDQVVMFDEHTWGSWLAVFQPQHPQAITSGIQKRNYASQGMEMSRYVQASYLADAARNPVMSKSEGLLAFNPSPLKQRVNVDLPAKWRSEIFGRLHGFNQANSEAGRLIPDDDFSTKSSDSLHIHLELEPFSIHCVPWDQCQAHERDDQLGQGFMEQKVAIQELDGHDKLIQTKGTRYIESLFHRLEYDPKNGRVTQLIDKQTGWNVLAGSGEYNLLEPIHEKPDPRFDASRKSYYDRVVDKEMRFEHCWNPDWKAVRTGVTVFHGVTTEQNDRSIRLIRKYSIEGAPKVIQRFTLSADHPWIKVDVLIHKDKVTSPESIYFVRQLNLDEGWKALYDSSGIPVRLDDDQLKRTSRGWITAEAFTRMEDGKHQFSVFAPEMPLTQFGGFNFGQPPESIPRNPNPLLLNWACNNYWETNFAASQEGIIRHKLAIFTSSGQSEADIYQMADGFARQPSFLPMYRIDSARCETLFRLNNAAVRLASIIPARYEKGLICRLINPGRNPQRCMLESVIGARQAAIINPLEEVVHDCELNGGEVTIDVPGRGIVSVLFSK